MATDSALTVKRVIDAPSETIWKALTEQEIMQKWFFAGDERWSSTVENNFQTGGSYRIEMHSPEDSYLHEGVYRKIVPHEEIVFSWNSQAVTDTIVTITLREVEGGTEVKLKHELMPDEKMKQNHKQGWTQILANLEDISVKK